MRAKITFLPEGKTIAVQRGISVLEAARRARIPIRTRCGGVAGCLMCKVTQRSAGGLTAPSDQERRKLEGAEGTGMRLACQAKVTGEAVVEVPEDPLRSAVRQQLARQREEEDKLW